MATGFTEFLDNFVKNHDNRQLLAFPLAILAVSLIILLVSFLSSGSPVTLGMDPGRHTDFCRNDQFSCCA